MSTPDLGRRGALLCAAAGALALAGCVVVPARDWDVEADQPPPPPRYEVAPVAPVIGWIWIAGTWRWANRGYVWVPGYWTAPRPGWRWEPHRWEPYGPRWRHYGGAWVRG